MLNLRSRLRRALLGYYFTNPTAEHYLRELAARLDADPANLSRELARRVRDGLFLATRRGRQKYFRLNRAHPLYDELRRIVAKTLGATRQLREALEQLPGIEEAYLYGSFARDQQDAASDIDLLLIGDPPAEELEAAIRRLERKLGREISYTLLSPGEFKARRSHRDAFLESVWRQQRISLVAAR